MPRTSTSFNPLHCGAVVASPSPPRRGGRAVCMSAFQSPSLRGSGRFARKSAHDRKRRRVSIPFIAGQWSLRRTANGASTSSSEFQSPSLRGSGRFIEATSDEEVRVQLFQSPSLRGSGRFAWACDAPNTARYVFQSPSLRGSGRFSRPPRRALVARRVSIPFIAGQWSLRAGELP